MGEWTQVLFTGLGLQMAAALIGAILPFVWIRVKGNDIWADPKLLKQAKIMGAVVFGTLFTGFALEIVYEAHLLF